MSNYRDKSVLNSFAKIAADEYLGKNSTALDVTLKKLATQEALTPFQIEYVASEANKAVWAKLFAMDKQASYNFDPVDAQKVIDELQIKPDAKEIKEIDLDYFSPPINTKVASFDPMSAMGIQTENVKTAAAKREIRRELQSRFEKMAAAKEELERQLYQVGSEIENLEVSFVKTARSMLLEQPMEERGRGMDKIAEFLRSCGGEPRRGQTLMKKLAHVLKRQGLIKESDLKAPEQYISDDLPARVVNGRHALYVTIKTLYDKYDWNNTLHSRYEIVDSSLPVVKEKIREL